MDQGDFDADTGGGGAVVGDRQALPGHVLVGLEDFMVTKGLWCFHGPETVALQVFQ